MANPQVIVELVANTTRLVDGMKGVEQSASGAAASVGKINWKKIAGFAAGAAAIGATVSYLKSAAEGTAELAKSTMMLQRATGMDAKTASAWISTLKVRNIEASSFQTMLVRLSNNMQDWATKGSGANSMLKDLGVRFSDVKKGNVNAVLMQIADAFAGMKNPAERAAAAQKLFGRSGQQLIPLLVSGSKGIREQLAMAEKYGATVGTKTTGGVSKLVQKQRELKLAQAGVSNSIGQALLPAQVELYGALLDVVQALLPITKNTTVMKVALIAAATAMGIYKVAVIASTLATAGLTKAKITEGAVWAASKARKVADTVATVANTIATKAAAVASKVWAAAQWLLNAALTANPIGLVVVAIVALVAAFVLAWKNSETFRKIVTAALKWVLTAAKNVFSWLKANWPLLAAILTGPIGIAAALIIKNWGRIKSITSSTFQAIKQTISNVLGAIRGFVSGAMSTLRQIVSNAWSAIRSGTSSAWGAVRTTVANAIAKVKDIVRNLVDFVSSVAGGILASATKRAGSVFNKIADGARAAYNAVRNIINDIVNAVSNAVSRIGAAASRIASAFKNPINAVIRAWNSITFSIPRINIPSVKIAGKKIGGGSFGGQSWGVPDINYLAKGGVVSTPTLAMVGEGRGREIVTPESLLRDIVGSASTSVRVFIGDTELKGMIRTEVDDSNTGIARTLLAGQSGR